MHDTLDTSTKKQPPMHVYKAPVLTVPQYMVSWWLPMMSQWPLIHRCQHFGLQSPYEVKKRHPKKSEAAKIPSFTAETNISCSSPKPRALWPSQRSRTILPQWPKFSTKFKPVRMWEIMQNYIIIYYSNSMILGSSILSLIIHFWNKKNIWKSDKNTQNHPNITKDHPKKSTKAQVDWSLEVIALLSLVLKGLVLISMAKSLENHGNFGMLMRRCGKISKKSHGWKGKCWNWMFFDVFWWWKIGTYIFLCGTCWIFKDIIYRSIGL